MNIPYSKEQLMRANEKLMQKNKRYKQALEMYADIDSYVGEIQWIVIDQGELARKALKGESDD